MITMRPTEKQIKDIAGQIDCGMVCYYNLKTGEIESLPNPDDINYSDVDELWAAEIKKVEDNRSDYFEFEKMDAHTSFRVMADFAEQIDDETLKDQLIETLERSKPFRNFKWLIDDSGKYRDQWFEFRDKRSMEWMKTQIEMNEEEFKD